MSFFIPYPSLPTRTLSYSLKKIRINLEENLKKNLITELDLFASGEPNDQCGDFPWDADGIRKIESAITSPEGNEIFGESLVNFVNDSSELIDVEQQNFPGMHLLNIAIPKSMLKVYCMF